MLISEDADDHYERQSHSGRPVRPATFLQLDRSDRLEHVGRADRLRGAHRGVIFSDQGFGIKAYGAGHAADVAAGVEVSAAAGEVATLDPADDGLSDTGAVADLRNRQASLAASLGQRVTD